MTSALTRRALPAVVATVFAISACAGSVGTTRGAGPSGGAAQKPGTAAPAISFNGGVPRPEKVLVVIDENHGQQAALDQMPYLASLAHTYGRTTAYHAITHPSLPNYLALAGGSTFGVTDDADPSVNGVSGPSIFDSAIAAGRTAKSYLQAMPTNCATTSTAAYAVKHNPWAYFTDPASRANCAKFDVPAGTPSAGALRHDIDAGTLPTIGLLVPDLCQDAHDCPLATADSYLKSWLPTVLAGPDYRAGRLVVIVTFDEDADEGDNTVLTTVIAPRTRGLVSNESFTHFSLTRYFAQLIRRIPPGEAAGAPQLRPAFGI